jgi:hypothetical protein
MAIRLYLHIGHIHGSSAHIGALLSANRQALLERGYGVCDQELAFGQTVGSDAFFEPCLNSPQTSGEAIEQAFAGLKTRAEKADLKAVIIHAPNLGTPEGARLVAAAKQYFDVRIIYYFRRQEELVVDRWMDGVFKTGLGLNAYIDEIISSHPRRYYRDALEAYLEVFGADAMRVQLLWFKVLEGGNLPDDFWHALELDPGGLEVVREPAPLVSSYLATALKESPYLFAGEDDEELLDFIRSYAKADAVTKISPLDVEPRRQVMEHFQPENRWIKMTFFADVDMPGWNAVPDSDDRPDDVTLAGITEAINLSFSMLKELSTDIARVKKKMGLK